MNKVLKVCVAKFNLMVLILLSFLLFSNFVYAGTTPMVTEWNIPTENTTIKLPILSNSRNSFTVDWGDMIVETFDSTSNFPSHTYTEAGIHTIQITGIVDTFGYTSTETATGTNYETFTQYLTGVSQFGELEATRYGFSQCTSLKSLPTVTENSFASVTDMSYIFYGCTGLTGTIPSNIFLSASNTTNFNSAFEGCSNLIGTVPSILFATAAGAKNFDRTFYNCSNLTGANINVSVIGSEMFYGCNKIVDIRIGNNVQTIHTNAFLATSPYSATNLLETMIQTANSVAESYTWENDYRNANLIINTDVSSFITEWKIPVDGDEVAATTGTAKTTIKLPIAANGMNYYTVDWGDGNEVETFDSSINFPTHTYTNIQEEIYTIKISGTVNSFGYNEEIIPTKDNINSDYYTFTQYIVQIVQWGEIDCRQYGFANCSNLTGEIVLPSTKTFKETTSFKNLFLNCSRLTGGISEGIFKNATKANNFSGTFAGCTGLNGTISNGLVAYSVNITRMNKMFYGCKNLTGSIPRDLFTSSNMTGNIPEDLFDTSNTSSVTDYSGMFYGCSNLTGFIPSNLFSKATSATDFSYVFYGCEKLSGTIPEELFTNSLNVTTFENAFAKCRGLTGKIPANLFAKNTNVLSFHSTFEDCSGLTGEISEGLFVNNTKVDSFDSTFKNCTGLSSAIPSNLFTNNTKATTFYYTFGGCTGLSGTLPQNLFTTNAKATNFSYTFFNCINLSGEITSEFFPSNTAITTLPSDLNTGASDDAFKATFYNCNQITAVEMNTLYIGFEMFKNCNELIDIKVGDKVQAIGTNAFYVGTPYSQQELLPTNLGSSNENAINYNWTSDNRIIVDPQALIMEWTIPAGGVTIKLPISQHANNNYTVNWGDGSEIETFDSDSRFPSHTYTNSVETIYTIEVKGTVDKFGYFNGEIIPTNDNESANYYTFTQYLTKLIRWGELNVSAIAFANCTNLTGKIPTPTIEEFRNLTSADYLFYNCSALIGNIPEKLFAKASNLESLNSTFYGCTSLSGKIPSNLFENNVNIKNVQRLFTNCSSLEGTIPEDLFANNKEITTFEEIFKNCTQIKNIPENLFANNTKVITFAGAFNGCTALSNIPENLFEKNTNVISFAWTFANCIGITTLPDTLFSTNVNVNNYKGTFYYCTGLDYIISTDLFKSSTAINSVPSDLTSIETEDAFSQTFEGCSNIELVNIDLLYIGYRMFYNCNNLVEFVISDNIQAIGTDAFEATTPYSSTNLLTTTLDSSDSVVTNYDWASDNRYIGNALITSWTIPAGGATIKLPIPSKSSNNFTVNWGDGKSNSYTTTAFPSHTYSNKVETTYDITISGTIHTFGYIEGYAREPGTSSNYYTFAQYLTGIKAWGNLGISTYGFAWCKNLTGKIPIAVSGTFKNVTTMYNLFYHCENLEGPIPQGLFNSATNVTEFYTAFGYCYDLKGPIPANLFAKSSKVQSFYSVFYNCPSLDGAIPKGLFANSTQATNFMSAFGACSSLTGPIPDDIFDNVINGTNFTSVFSGCKSLSGEIPAGLFANTKGQTFTNSFHSCENLTGTIPPDMFPSANTATNIQGTFYGCKKLEGGELTLDTTNVTTTVNLFYNCSGLENLVFGESFKKFDSENMFYGTTNLEKIILQKNVSSTSAVPKLGDLTTIAMDENTIIYVPTRSDEAIYESAWNGIISANRVEPILKLVGEEVEAYLLNEPYIDKGVSVANYTNEDSTTISPKMSVYGYKITQTYNNVDVNNVGVYEVEYELSLDDALVDTITRGSVIITVPPTKPVITVTNEDGVVESDTWSNKELTIQITGSSLDGPGGIEYRYSYDEKTWYNYEAPFVFSTDTAATTMYVRAVNNYNEEFVSDTVTYEIKLDTTAPTGVVLETTPTTNTIATEVTSVDGSVSGVKEYEFYLDGELKAIQTSAVYVFQNLEAETNYTIGVKVRDNLDNVTDLITKVQATNEDPTEINLIPNTKEWTNGDVTVTIEWPVTTVTKQIKDGDGEWQEYNDTSYNVTENTILEARLVDGETVINTVSLTIENIDKKLSTVTLPETISYSKPIQLTLEDEISGVNGWQITSSEEEPTSGWTSILPTMSASITDTIIRNAGTYYVWAKDQANNITKTEMVINKKDLIVTPALNQGKVFGESDPELTYSYGEQESGQVPKFEGTLSREAGENAGNYLITLGTLTLVDNTLTNFEAQNYNLVLNSTPVYFEIEEIDLSTATVTLDESEFTYTGSGIEIDPTILLNSTTLVKNVDYEIFYENNINVGTATATIMGIGNYKGSISNETFTIIQKPVTVTALPQTIVKDTTVISQDVSNASLSSAVDGHALTSIVLTATELTETTGTVTPSDAIIMDGTTDVTANYDITYEAGELIITKHYYSVGGNTFETLEEAIAGATSGNTITVLQDVPDDGSNAIVDKNVILDTNGYTLTKTTTPIRVNSGSSLTIIGTGEITTLTLDYAIYNKGTLNVNSGTISGKTYAIQSESTAENMVIGDATMAVNNNNPVISGGEYAINAPNGFTFNNGVIKGTNAIPYQGEVTPRSLHYMVETSGPEENIYSAYLMFSTEDAIITEWTIPVDADKTNGTTATNKSGDTITLGSQTTIKLPIPSNANNDYAVDWGDGSEFEVFDSSADFPTHTYTNTTETVYTIKVTGTVNSFGYYGDNPSKPTQTNSYKQYYTFVQYLTGLKQWGEVNATRYGFAYCEKLSSTIPEATENTFTKVKNMTSLFYNCELLRGNIPENLFASATEVTTFKNTFNWCRNLTGSIPENLFTNNTKNTSFFQTFLACEGLTGSLSENLFATNVNVTNFNSTFSACYGITGNIPPNLFKYNVNVVNMFRTFTGCGFTGSIPENLFETNTKVNNFEWTFGGCSGLTGEIPEKLFRTNTEVTNFQITFVGCSGLTGNIPSSLFETNTKVQSFNGIFSGCSGLTGEIPATLFSTNTEATHFNSAFEGCSGLVGSIPSSLFTNNKEAINFKETFSECSGLTGIISEELFASQTKTIEIPTSWNSSNSKDYFGRTFYKCTGLTQATINTLYIGYEMFYGCNSLTDITIGDNVQAIGTNAFQATSPYSFTNPLITNLITTNDIAYEHDWAGDNRADDKFIIKEPEDVNTKVYNEASFTVVASGDALEYQWYEVVSGDTIKLTEENTKIFKSNIEGKANSTSSSTIRISTTENRTISFEYMVDSEKNGDLFTITIEDANGIVTAVDGISGTVDWTKYEKECIPTAAGEIIITLTYSKNATVDQGLDYGAIRNLKYLSVEVKQFTLEEDENFEVDSQFAIMNPPSISYQPFDIKEEDGNKIMEVSTLINSGNQVESMALVQFDDIYEAIFVMIIDKETKFSFDYRIVDGKVNQAEIIPLTTTKENRIVLLDGAKPTQVLLATMDGNGQNMIYNGFEATNGWVNYTTTLVPNEAGIVRFAVGFIAESDSNASLAIRNVSLIFDTEEVSTFDTDDIYTFENSQWESVNYEGVNNSTLTIPAEQVTLDKNGNKYYCEVSNYMGSVTTREALLTVNDRRIDINTADISYIKNYVYDGTAKTPTPVVMLEGTTLVKGIDYRVDYENNIESGVGTLVITGIGQYKGIVEKEIIISILQTEVDVTDATLPSGTYEPSASDIILSTDTAWTQSKEFEITAEDEDSKPIRIKIQDITNAETGYSFVDQYGITGRDDTVEPPVNTREYLFSGDVTGYVTIAVNKMDIDGNETTEYLRIYNIDNTAPEIIMETILENLEETKVQLKDSGSGLRYFGITSATQIKEPSQVSESETLNGTTLDTWYRVKNATADNPETLDAQDITVTFPRLTSGIYKFWAKDLVGNVSNVEFEVSNRPLTLESSHTLDREWYEQDGIINLLISTKAERYEMVDKTLIGKDLIAKLKVKDEKGKITNLSDNLSILLNGASHNVTTNGNETSIIYTVQTDLDESSFEKTNNIQLDMTKLDVSEYLKTGMNTIVVEYYLGENNVPERKVSTYEIDLEIRRYKYFSIVANVKSQDGKIGDELLSLTQGTATSRTVILNYVGDLEEPYVTIKLQKKNGTNASGANQYEAITNTATVAECNPLKVSQEIVVNFAETLEAGEYQLLFELYDKYNYKRATEGLNFKVN